MENKQDVVILIGLLLQKLGGEVEISAAEQLEFMTGLTQKELLQMHDPATNNFKLKLVNKKDIENPMEYMNKAELKEN